MKSTTFISIKSKSIAFLKKETILCVASLLAVISCFFTHPSASYNEYIDYRTLSLLFCLMTVMEGMKHIGIFDFIGQQMLKIVHYRRGIIALFVMLCFFSSMFITNDVALITFVPLALLVIPMTKLDNTLIITVVLMTIAANLGSMLTPIGNPQNLYLFSQSGYTFMEFTAFMLPYTLLALVALLAVILFVCRKKTAIAPLHFNPVKLPFSKVIFYTILFFLCLLSVARILDYRILLLLIVILIGIVNPHILKQVDYTLLLTFIAFFLFIGNMSHYTPFCQALSSVISGHETRTAIFASQFISNVPAALLLSGFTKSYGALLIGTNIGGLGTLIASMASLISYKQIAFHHSELRVRYIIVFTLWNIVFLLLYTLFIFIYPLHDLM